MVFAINCRQILSNNARRSLERNNLNVTTNFAGFKIQSLQTLLFLRTKNGSDVKDGGRTRTIFQVNNNDNLMQRRRQNLKKKIDTKQNEACSLDEKRKGYYDPADPSPGRGNPPKCGND